MAETRRLIVEAAAEAFAERGISATSMQEVARRADVAPATVINHFPESHLLAEAVIAHVFALMELPTREIFKGLTSPDERLARLIRGFYDSYTRGDPWGTMHRREANEIPALRSGSARLRTHIRELLADALGPLADDEQVMHVARAALDPDFRAALLRTGVSHEEAVELATQLVARWLRHHPVATTV